MSDNATLYFHGKQIVLRYACKFCEGGTAWEVGHGLMWCTKCRLTGIATREPPPLEAFSVNPKVALPNGTTLPNGNGQDE